MERRVSARLTRQQLLTTAAEEPVELSCVLLETVLRVRVGGSDTHRRQLSHLLDVGGQRNVSIQVLPFSRVPPTALVGPLVVLETKELERHGYMEGHTASSFTSTPEDISTLMRRHGIIRMKALSDEESARFIERTVEEL